jgi:hypothetical protein
VITGLERCKQIVAECHRVCRHRRWNATYLAIKDCYFWPNLYDDIAWHVQSCNAYQYHSKVCPVEPLSITLSLYIFRRFVLDTIYIPDGLYGFKFLMHGECTTSKWEEARAARVNNSSTWVQFM